MPTSWRVCAVSALLAAVSVCCATQAIATPDEPAPAPPPPPPAPVGPIPPLAGIGNALAQSGTAATGPFGLPDLSAYGANLLLGQNPVPSVPGGSGLPVIPSFNAFDPGYLVPQNTTPAAPGDGTAAAGIGPDADSPGTGRIAFLRRLHEMYAAGQLDGALLGQQPPEVFSPPAPDQSPPAG